MSSTAQMEWTPTKQAILGPDPALLLYGEVSVWFHKLELFRRGENERMFLREPGKEDREIHKTLLIRLIADGEHLLTLIEQAGELVQNGEGIKKDDLAAAVKGLHDTLRGWHGSMTSQRRNEILTKVFGDVA